MRWCSGRRDDPAGDVNGLAAQDGRRETMQVDRNIRTLVRVDGVVQGVGFRPFVYALATRLGLAGHVGNDARGVFVEIEGPEARVGDFLASLEHDAPPLARIDRVRITAIKPNGSSGFSIAPSDRGGQRRALVAADSATCQDCLRELADPTDRRFGYPFINCTNCGPRFTIVRDVPYDRPLTTMAGFPMCAECAGSTTIPRIAGSMRSRCAVPPAARGCACLTRRSATSRVSPSTQCARLLARGSCARR